jgi:hypothetical protein
MTQYIVLKDFLTLLKGDIISIHTFGIDSFSFYVENRYKDVKEYTLFKDRKVDSPKFIWKQVLQEPFTAMEFKVPLCPVNKDLEFCNLYSHFPHP